MKSRSCKHPLELPQAEGFDMNAFQSNNPIKTRVHRHGKHWFQIDCSLFDFHKLCISCKTALQKMKDCALLGQITQRRARQDALRRVIFPKRSRSRHPLRRCPEIKNAAPLGGSAKMPIAATAAFAPPALADDPSGRAQCAPVRNRTAWRNRLPGQGGLRTTRQPAHHQVSNILRHRARSA